MKNLELLEAENALLASILYHSGTDHIAEDIFSAIEAKDFASTRNQVLYAVMNELHRKGKSVDCVTLYARLEETGQVNAAGGVDRVLSLSTAIPTNANYKNYLDIVQNMSKKRTLARFARYIIDQSKTDKTGEALQNEAESCLSKIAMRTFQSDILPISNSLSKEYDRILKACDGKYEPFGVRTGFTEFDKCLWGLRPGTLTILSGRPGTGKTAWANNVLYHAAARENKTCAFFSLEMSADEIARRLFSIGAGIDSSAILSGKGIKERISQLDKVKELLDKNRLFIDDTTNQTPQQILNKCKKLQRKQGLDLVVIDYLQKIKPPRALNNPVTEIGEIVRAVKDISRQLKIPVLCLCQNNRQSDKAKGSKAQDASMSDLRGSGEIEQEADVIGMLLTDSPRESEEKEIFLQLAKNRNGRIKTFKFEFIGHILTFKEKGSNNNKLIPLSAKQQDELPF